MQTYRSQDADGHVRRCSRARRSPTYCSRTLVRGGTKTGSSEGGYLLRSCTLLQWGCEPEGLLHVAASPAGNKASVSAKCA